jgi:hypothetical protein
MPGRLVLTIGLLLGAAQQAQAQFVGDIFFVQPSVVIPRGSTGQLQLAMFTGTQAFGVAGAVLRFDPSKLEIVSVSGVASGPFTPRTGWSNANGVLRIVAVNGQSLQQPFGTVGMARIEVRPLANAGERITIRSEVQQAFGADRKALRAGTGFNAEVSVGAVAASPGVAGPLDVPDSPEQSVIQSAVAADPSELVQRASRLRPPGHVVELYAPSLIEPGRFGRVVVRLPGAVPAVEGTSIPARQ